MGDIHVCGNTHYVSGVKAALNAITRAFARWQLTQLLRLAQLPQFRVRFPAFSGT